ncbi:MAG: TonB-dependent receptor [Porticoccaceae bacterium]|nr:TonB-dependent receptor [Porticoccaceae bacterium]
MDSNRPNVTVFKIFSAIFASALLASTSANIFAQESVDNEGIDEIIVTGIRASLQDAINKKRNANDIRDVVNAEDIGKLPDRNVADALSRITGVQIGRSFGEGNEVVVRGIASNRIELNGQTQVGTGASRGISEFSGLPAEMFSSLEVIKTPSAKETEGGLGAIVRLNTRKPLDSPGVGKYTNIAVGSLYGDVSGDNAPRGSVYHTQRWNLDGGARLGVNLNVTHSGRKARQDYALLKGWQAQNQLKNGNCPANLGTCVDLDGNGVIEDFVANSAGQIIDLNDAAFVPMQTAFAANLQDRTNTAFRSTLHYQPEDGSDWIMDMSRAKAERRDQRYQYTTSFNSRQLNRDYRDVVYTDNQTAIAGTVGAVKANGQTDRGTGLNIQASRAPYDGTTTTFALSNERQLSSRLSMYAQAAYGKGEQTNDQIYATVVYGVWAQLPFVQYDFSGTDVPSIIPNSRTTDALGDETRVDFLDPAVHKLNGILYQDQHENNVDKAFKMDFDYEMDFGSLNLIEFGFRIAERTGERYRNRGKDNQNNNSEGDGILAGLSFPALEEYLPGRLIVMPHTDMLDGASGDFLTDYLAIDANWLMNMGDEMENIGGTIKTFDSTWGFTTKEETRAIYLMGNFDGIVNGGIFGDMEYSGNIGARYVQTDQTSTANVMGEDGSSSPTTEDASYSNFLPSLNIALDLSDQVKLRLGAAKALARAPMRDIAPMTTLYFFTQSGNTGNKDLVPEKVTQFDLSLEYYMDEGGLMSAAYFQKHYKDAIENGFVQRCFTANPGEGEENRDEGEYCPDSVMVSNSAGTAEIGSQIYYNLTSKVNAGDTKLTGLELAYEQPLTMLPSPFDRTGLKVNYTHVDSNLLQTTKYGYPVGLQKFSENSYNAEVWYSHGKLNGRVGYKWRDKFYDTLTQANAAQFMKPYGELKIQMDYDITKKVNARLSIENVLGESERLYQEIEERFLGYKMNDTMIMFEVKAVL